MNTSAPAEQRNQQRAKQRGRPWRSGQSGNPSGSRPILAKRAVMEAQITADLGGDISATDQILLSRAVELLCRRPRSYDDAVRLTNAASRILQTLRAKYSKDDDGTVPSLQELEELGRGPQ